MKAILMAAGVGSRISRSISKPKSTLDVGGIPLIRKTVSMLESKGVEVAVVVGFKYDAIKDALRGHNVTFYHNPFYKVTNSIASLWFARDFIGDDDLILANADVFWEESIFDILVEDDRSIVMLGDESRADRGDYFFNVKDDLIVRYGKELLPEERNSEYVGIAKISESHLANFKKNLDDLIFREKYDLWWENVLYENLLDMPVYVRDISQFFWAEIDYIDDYQRISEYIRTNDVNCKNIG